MKKTIVVGLVVLVIGAAAYMYQDLKSAKPFTPVHDFAKDDEALYQLMRKDLESYLAKKKEPYGGWLDDQVQSNYDSGAYSVNGQPSKAAAFAAAAGMHYKEKKGRYNGLIDNLTTIYS